MNAAVYVCTAVERIQLGDPGQYEWRSTLERETGYGKHIETSKTLQFTPGCKYLLTFKIQGEA